MNNCLNCLFIINIFQIDKKSGVIDFHGGREWCILKLGIPGKATQIQVDTNHFKGNFPESFWVEGRAVDDKKEDHFPITLLGLKLKSNKWEVM